MMTIAAVAVGFVILVAKFELAVVITQRLLGIDGDDD